MCSWEDIVEEPRALLLIVENVATSADGETMSPTVVRSTQERIVTTLRAAWCVAVVGFDSNPPPKQPPCCVFRATSYDFPLPKGFRLVSFDFV